MKRFHVHVAVEKLEESVRFYSALFGHPPTVEHSDYAKWMLEDPRLNFAISQRGRAPGINHIGLQVETPEELEGLRGQLVAASEHVLDEKDTTCCYARSDKHWVTDPSGIAWETFRSLGEAVIYGDDGTEVRQTPPTNSGCCAPASATTQRRACCG